MEKTLRIITIFCIVSTVLFGLSFFFNPEWYHHLVKEDGLVENITALTLLLSSLYLLINTLSQFQNKNRGWIVVRLLLTAGLFFGFGEEISWGQRVLSIDSGVFFNENNLQNETNFHNLEINGIKLNKIIFTYLFFFVFGIYFLVLRPLYNRREQFKNFVNHLGIPIARIQHTAAILILLVLVSFIPNERKWELWECLFVLVLFLTILRPHSNPS